MCRLPPSKLLESRISALGIRHSAIAERQKQQQHLVNTEDTEGTKEGGQNRRRYRGPQQTPFLRLLGCSRPQRHMKASDEVY